MNHSPEPIRLARRLAYEDALLALGVPASEAARRAARRYPRSEQPSAAPAANPMDALRRDGGCDGLR